TGLSAKIASLLLPMDSMSFLYRAEETRVPSWLFGPTSTVAATAPTLVPRIPPKKTFEVVPATGGLLEAMRVVLNAAAIPFIPAPIQILLPPVVRALPAVEPIRVLLSLLTLAPAAKPTAVLKSPVMLVSSALSPIATLLAASMLLSSALTPKAWLKLPMVLLKIASSPTALFERPIVLLRSA